MVLFFGGNRRSLNSFTFLTPKTDRRNPSKGVVEVAQDLPQGDQNMWDPNVVSRDRLLVQQGGLEEELKEHPSC